VLEPIVRNQIERLAPWPADKALFAYETALAPNGTGTLDVPVVIAARALVEGLVAELHNLGFPPGRVDYGADAGAEPRLNLLAAGGGSNRRSGRLVLATLGFLWLAALAAGAVGNVGVVQQAGELAALGTRLDELRAATAAHLPGQAGQRRRAWLAAQKAAQPSMAVALEALSRALPDTAWLTRLEVEQGVVRLAGNAASAAALIGQVEASGHFADVQFAAPTTLGDEAGQESFTITARILPGRTLN
jgi:general secretion pathway protein L